MIRMFALAAAAALAAPSMALSKDCTPVETSPGVKSKPWGCADLGRATPPKKPEDGRLTGNERGIVYSRDGTTVRVFGRAVSEVGVRSR
jgi:hypothetical protein